MVHDFHIVRRRPICVLGDVDFRTKRRMAGAAAGRQIIGTLLTGNACFKVNSSQASPFRMS